VLGPIVGLNITPPASCMASTPCIFTATVSPGTAGTPIDYLWSATGLTGQSHPGQGLTDPATFNWPTAGLKTVGVQATNAAAAGAGLVGVQNVMTASVDIMVTAPPDIPEPGSLLLLGSGLLGALGAYGWRLRRR
jgi:hypothetical protein